MSSSVNLPAPEAPAREYGYPHPHLLLALLTLLNVISFVDRNLLQSFVVDVRRELDLSFLQFSILIGPVLDVSVMVAVLFMGSLADRCNRLRLISAAFFVWSLSMIGIGMGDSFWSLAVPLCLLAVALSALPPAAVSLISDLTPPHRQASASAIYYTGVSLGVGGSLLVAGTLGAVVGWRQCFMILGLGGGVLALLVWLIPDPGHKHPPSGSPSASHVLRSSWNAIRSTPALRYTILGAMLITAGQSTHNIDQAWLVRERGFSVVEGQLTFGIIILIAGVCGSLLGGLLSDFLYRRHPGGRLWFLAVAMLMVVPLEALFRFLPSSGGLFLFVVFLGAMTVMMPYGPLLASVAQLAPQGAKSTVVAFCVVAMSLGGALVGNVMVGALIDFLIAQGMERPMTWGLFGASMIGTLAAPLFFVAARSCEGDVEH
jgi:predicted MFS family arabinose efflux permease